MIHIFSEASSSSEEEPFHGRSVNCDDPDMYLAGILFHRDTMVLPCASGDRPGGFCPHCGKRYESRWGSGAMASA